MSIWSYEVGTLSIEYIYLEYEKVRIKRQLKLAKKAGTPATLTIEEWIVTLYLFGEKCAYCQNGDFTLIEHFIPISLGGGTTEDNCIPACNRCNNIKWARHPYELLLEKTIGEGIQRVYQYLKARQASKSQRKQIEMWNIPTKKGSALTWLELVGAALKLNKQQAREVLMRPFTPLEQQKIDGLINHLAELERKRYKVPFLLNSAGEDK